MKFFPDKGGEQQEHKTITIAGKKIKPFYLMGAALFFLVIIAALQFNLGPFKEIKTGLKDLNLEIFKQISSSGGIGAKVETSKAAVASIDSVALDLEKTRGSLSELNKGLEKK